MRWIPITALLVAVTGATGCPSTDVNGSPGGGGAEPASITLDSAGGALNYGPWTLLIPEGALREPTTLTLRAVTRPPRGAVGPAYEFGPDGLAFTTPATLRVSFDPLELPPGVDRDRLRLCVYEEGRWVPVEDQVHRRFEHHLVGSVRHFSVYGVVPEPRAVSATGTRFEANGVVVETTSSVVGRLFVSPTNVSFYAERDATDGVTATFWGLPTDDDNYAYVDSYGDLRVIRPADAGRLSVDLLLDRPAVVWIQPQPGTWRIAAPPLSGDECTAVGGIRTADTCTLTADVAGSIELASGILDCDGHRIAQPPFAIDARQTGIGVFVGENADSAIVRNCVIGGAGRGFAQGVYALGNGVVVEDSELDDNLIGVLLQGVAGGRVEGNRFAGDSLWALAVWDSSVDGSFLGNSFSVDADAIAIEGPTNLPAANHGHEVSGNVVSRATGGILLAQTRDNRVTENDVSGVLTALLLAPNAWPNRVWWNDFHAWTRWGVWSDVGPAELSDAGRGNWWGRNCPGGLFVPGVDGNRSDVRDSAAYGGRSTWSSGTAPGCGALTDGVPICPEDANAGSTGVVWDDYEPTSPVVAAAWTRLRAAIESFENAAQEEERAAWAAQGLNLPVRPAAAPIVRWNRDTGNPRLIAGRMTAPTTRAASAVVNGFLHDYRDLFAPVIPSRDIPDLRRDMVREESGGTLVRLQQYHRGVRVRDGVSTLFVDSAGVVRWYKGQYFPNLDVDLRNTCSRRDAEAGAAAQFLEEYPDAVDLRFSEELVLDKSSDGASQPIWTGSIWSAEDARGDRERRFVLDGRDCAVREFGSADDTAIEERGAGSVTAPVPGSFLGFGAGWTDRAAMSTPALKTFWYTHGSDERLWSEAAGVLGTYNSRARAAGARIPPNGTCSVAGITLPCWDYPVQRPGDDIGWDGCFPNDEASRCDHWYSHYDCTTAFWRVEDRAEHVLALESGYSSPRGIRLGNEFYLWCHDDIANSTYRTPACCRDQLILRPARASGSFDEFHTIDHEFGHHLTNGLLGTIPARGDGCCYRHDLGQSQSIGEVLADFFPDIWSGQLPGTLHSSLQMMGGGWDGRPTGGLYPTYDLERTDCRPFPVLIPLACTTNANCAPKSYCWDGVCRTRCLYVGPSFVDDDSHNFHGEPGDHDPHGPANGRVLAQALADWHERFGSSAFQPALPFAYDDGDGRHATMFSADVLQPDGTKIPVARDWGVSHSLENNSSGVFECNEGGMYTLIRQRIIIREPYVGQMLVSFGRIRLPTDAEMRIRTDRDEGYAVVGPLDFDPVEDGWLFSSFLPGQEIRVEVDGRLSGPIASRRCSNGPPVFVRAWRHIEGDQAERIVLRAMQRSHHTDDWYDFYEAIMVADRELHGPVMQHQGEFFRIGFEGHGIDRRLGEFCSHHPYGCHAGPR